MTTPPLRERVLQAASGHAVPARPDRRSARLPAALMLPLAAGAMWLVLWLAGGSSHAGERPTVIGVWMVGGTALLALAATALALPPARSMLPRPRGQLLAVMAGAPVLIGLWVALWHAAYDDPFTRVGFRCFAFTALTAPWPFAALVALRRRPDPLQPMLTGGALGAAAGAWAAMMLELWCPLASAGHVVLGHVAPLAAVVLAGALAGRRLFRAPRVEDGARSFSPKLGSAPSAQR